MTRISSFSGFVGRVSELQQLQAHLNAVIAVKKPRLVLLQGEFGVGKTALAERFLEEVSKQASTVLIGQAKCAMETEGNGLIPFSQFLADVLEEVASRQILPGSVTEFVKEVAPAWLDILTVGTASKVFAASAKTLEQGKKLTRRAVYTQDQVYVQFTNALRRLAEKQPIVGFLDDLQWADASSLRLLFHLVRNLETGTLLLISAYRPVDALETGTNAKLFREIRPEIIRYGTAEIEVQAGLVVKEYVARRYPRNSFPAELLARVQSQTDGHALFVSQLFALWEETGVVEAVAVPDEQPIWRVSRAADVLTLPPKLSVVLDKRIEQMTDELRDVLTGAAVEGEDFTAQVVARIRQLGERQAFDDLEALEDRYHMIHEQGIREVSDVVLDFYRFVHRFFREHVYDKMKSGKRVMLHRQVGECLEALYQNDCSPVAGQLAHHFNEAHLPLKAAQYALMAAQVEQRHYALAVSEQWCEFGLKLLEPVPPTDEKKAARLKFDLTEKLGDVLYLIGNWGQSDQCFRECLTLAQQLSLPAEQIANLYEKLSDVCELEGHSDEVIRFTRQGKQILLDNNIPLNEVYISLDHNEAFMQMRAGKNAEAVQLFKKLLADMNLVPQTLNLEWIRAAAYNALGIAYGSMNRYTEALGAYQRAVETAERAGSKSLVATCLLNIADEYLKQNDLAQSQIHTERALKLAHQIGDLDDVAYAQANNGAILLRLGKIRDSIAEIREAINKFERLGSMWNMPYMYADLAMAHLALSEVDVAYEYAQRALTYIEKTESRFAQGIALDVLAQVEVAKGDRQAALQHFQESIAVHREAQHRQYEGRAQRHFAEALVLYGEKLQAVELLEAALRIFQESELTAEITETQKILASATIPSAEAGKQ